MPPPSSLSERYTKPGRIDARPKNPRYMSGLSTFYALQNRNVPAFSDPRRPGMSAREIGEDAASMGYQLGKQGLRPAYMRDSPQPAPTREDNIAAAKASGSFADIRRKFNRENTGKRMNNRGDIIEVKAKAAAPMIDDTPGAASAKAREKFFGPGKTAPATPVAVEEKITVAPTPITPTGVTAAQRRQMLRDAVTGRSETRTDGRISGIDSRYGLGSSKVYAKTEEERKTGARPSAIPRSTTTDEFGKPETMKSFLARRKAIQSTKGMN